MKKYIPYGRQCVDEDDIKEVMKVLRSDWITQGPKIKEFEERIAKYCGAKFAVAFASGTAALHSACFAAGIGKDDIAITSPITFAASANCVLYCGGKPDSADIKSDTYNIDPVEILKRFKKKTKALIPVHFSGQPCDMEEINKIARRHNLIVIEDAAHSLGADFRLKGKYHKVGSCRLSDMAAFSFHPVKHITTGEGGIVTTNNKKFYERLLVFRTHGITRERRLMGKDDGNWYYEMVNLGYNYRITDFQCALGISQLKKLNKFVQRRREIASIYNERFSSVNEIVTPFEKKDVRASYHIYVIKLILEKLKVSRKVIFDDLRNEGIGVNVHYIPVHLQPYYRKRFGYKKGDFPIAEDYYSRALTLPIYPKMTDIDVEFVIKKVKMVINKYRKRG